MTVRIRALGYGLIVAYLVVAPLVFSVATVESFEFPKVLLLRTVALALLALGGFALLDWTVRGRLGGRLRAAIRAARHDPIVLAAGAWLVAGALSTAASLSPRVSFWGAHESFAGFATLMSYAVLFAASRILVRSVADLRLALGAALAAGAGVTTYGLFQLWGVDPIAWNAIPQSGGFERIASTMGNPNFLGGYLAMVFPVGLCFALQGVRRGARIVPAILGLGLVASLIVSFSTLSRGVAIAHFAGFGALLFGWWRTGERAALAWIAGSMVALVLLVGIGVAGTETGRGYAGRAMFRVERTLDLQRDLRIEFWTAALSMFRAEPVLGVGLDAYKLAFPRHARPSFRRRVPEATPARAHNVLLHTAATQGSVGVVAGLLLLLAIGLGWLRALRLASTDEERTLLVALGAAIAALLARNLVSFTVVGMGGLGCVLAGSLARHRYAHTGEVYASALSRRGARLALAAGSAAVGIVFLANSRLAASGSLAVELGVTATLTGVVACFALGLGFLPAVRNGVATEPAHSPKVRSGLLRAVSGALVIVMFVSAVSQIVVRSVAADVLARHGLLLMEGHQPRQAVPLFERAVWLDPRREMLWVELGLAHHGVASGDGVDPDVRGDHLKRAVAAHLRALELVPVQVVNQANVGRGFAELRGWTLTHAADEPDRETARTAFAARAYAHFDAALELDPFSRAVYFDATKAARGFRDESRLAHYATAWSAHHPTHAQARAQLGIAAMMRSDWQAAEFELMAATEGRWAGAVSDEVGNWVNLATTQLELGKGREALESSEAALAMVPRYLPALRTRARAYESLANSAVSEHAGNVASLDPRRATGYRRLAAADWAARQSAMPDDSEARDALARLKSEADIRAADAVTVSEEAER